MRENKREKSVKSRRSIKLINHYKEKKITDIISIKTREEAPLRILQVLKE